MTRFLSKLRLPFITGDLTSQLEGNAYYNSTLDQPRYNLADGSAVSFSESDRFSRYTTGRWYAVQPTQVSTVNANPSRAFAVPMPMVRYGQLSGICLEVSTAWTTAGTVRLGVYKDNGNASPGALAIDLGTQTATAAIKTWTTTLDLFPGLYWIVCANQGGSGGTTGQFRANAGMSDWVADTSTTPTSTFMNGSNTAYYSDTGFSGAFPSTFGTVAGCTLGPRFAVKFGI